MADGRRMTPGSFRTSINGFLCIYGSEARILVSRKENLQYLLAPRPVNARVNAVLGMRHSPPTYPPSLVVMVAMNSCYGMLVILQACHLRTSSELIPNISPKSSVFLVWSAGFVLLSLFSFASFVSPCGTQSRSFSRLRQSIIQQMLLPPSLLAPVDFVRAMLKSCLYISAATFQARR